MKEAAIIGIEDDFLSFRS